MHLQPSGCKPDDLLIDLRPHNWYTRSVLPGLPPQCHCGILLLNYACMLVQTVGSDPATVSVKKRCSSTQLRLQFGVREEILALNLCLRRAMLYKLSYTDKLERVGEIASPLKRWQRFVLTVTPYPHLKMEHPVRYSLIM